MAAAGFSSSEVCAMAGVTYRQLDYWTRLGLVSPSITPAAGYGSQRRWSTADLAAVTRIGEIARNRNRSLAELVGV